MFDDGARTLLFEGTVKIGSQSFSADSVPISSPAGAPVTPAGDASAQAKLVMNGVALQPGETAHVTIGGNVRIAGTNGSDVIALAPSGGTFQFDGSFNRGGDTIILTHDAASYTAVRLGSSSIVIAALGEQLTIPIGQVGLTLRFTDGDRTLVFAAGKILVGDQEIAGTTPAPLSPFAHILSLDQGSDSQSVTLTAQGKVLFNEDANVTGNAVIKNFTSDDLIHVTHAAPADYSFTASASDPTDLVITFNNGTALNTIILDGVLPPQAFVADYQSAAQALGAGFMSFG